jgi:hypothetical protein
MPRSTDENPSSEDNFQSTGHEILSFSQNLAVHYRTHNSHPIVIIPSTVSQFYTRTSITFGFTAKLFCELYQDLQAVYSIEVFQTKFYKHFLSPLIVLHIFLDIISLTVSDEWYQLWSCSLCNFFYFLLLSMPVLVIDILLSVLLLVRNISVLNWNRMKTCSVRCFR